MEFAIAESRLDSPHTSGLLVHQARAFLESYLRRRVG